jgi:catechol 2,3-dioxygenase-like lactoylglutathione lyase family enzyme
MAIDVHLDGLTLSVANVRRSTKFYGETLGFKIVVDAAPDFALVRVGGKGGGTIGLLALKHAVGGKVKRVTPAMRAGAHPRPRPARESSRPVTFPPFPPPSPRKSSTVSVPEKGIEPLT